MSEGQPHNTKGGWADSHWGDLATLEYGKGLRDYRNSRGPHPVFGTNGRIGYHTDALSCGPTVIVGRKGAYRGVHYSPKPCWVIDTAFRLKPRKEIDTRWAYYELLNQDINKLDSGSAIPSTSREEFYALPVTVPPIQEQRAIAQILGAFDDKIELNRRMGETLDEAVRALFKSRFVGRQSCWSVKSLAEVSSTIKGRSYRSTELVKTSDTAMVTLKSFRRGGGYSPDGLKPFKGAYKHEQVVRPGDVVVACTDVTQAADVVGRSAVVQRSRTFGKLVASLDVLVVRPIGHHVSSAFLYGLTNTRGFVVHAQSYATGTTVLHMDSKAVPSFRFRCPPREQIAAFDRLAEPAIERCTKFVQEADCLKELRDALLPKLLSGEIRIRNAERIAEAAT